MKKIMALLLIAAFTFSALAGCGSSTPKPTPTPTPPATVSATPTPTPTPEPTKEETDPFPGVDLGGITLKIKIDDDKNPDKCAEAEKEKWAARKAAVEKKFNCVLDFNVMEGVDWNDIGTIIAESVAANDPAVDAAFNLSRYYADVLFTEGSLTVDLTDIVKDYLPKSYYKGGGEWVGKTYAFNYKPMSAPGILVFNRDLIKAAGMEKDPGEMFAEGKWSLQDFYDYLVELDTKLPEDVYPFGLHFLHFLRGATYANGAGMMDPETYLHTYTTPEFYEPIDMFGKMYNDGLMKPPAEVYNDDGSLLGYDWTPGGEGFKDGAMAISFASDWSFGEIGAEIDFGVVPFPWGSNVTIKNNDYTTLSSNYNSFYVDNNIIVLFKHAEKKITAEQFMNLTFSYFVEEGEQLLIDREKEAKKEPITQADAGTDRYFYTDLDVELWDWYQTRIKFEPFETSNVGVLYSAVNRVAIRNTSAREQLESILGQTTYLQVYYGILTYDDLPDDYKALYDEYEVTLEEE